MILTASYGSGHNAAAAALAGAFAEAGAEAVVVDHFRECVSPTFDRLSRELYFAVLRHAPLLWAAGYELGDRLRSDARATLGMTAVGSRGLAERLVALAPDVVVTCHPTPSAALARLARRGHPVPFHVTVLTDFVAHGQWIVRDTDLYCVPARAVRQALVARGVPRGRVVVTGMPLRREFDDPVDAVAARRALGLRPDGPVVLAMAGARGSMGRLDDVAEALLSLRRPVQGVLVVGKDSRLLARLARRTAGSPLRVLGRVEDVRTLMAAADLLVTKAGGMTLAEAIASGLPLLAYGSLPGQERRNERFAVDAGIALVARDRAGLARELERVLESRATLDRLRAGAERARQPAAARRIAELALRRVALRT